MNKMKSAPGSEGLPRAFKKVTRGSGTRKSYKKTAGCASRNCVYQNLPPHVHSPGVLDRIKTDMRRIEIARQSRHLKRNIPRYSRRITQAAIFGLVNGRRP